MANFAKRKIAPITQFAASSLGEIGITAVEKDFVEETWETILILKEIQALAIEKNLVEEVQNITNIFEKIANVAKQNNYNNLALEMEQYKSKIGKSKNNKNN